MDNRSKSFETKEELFDSIDKVVSQTNLDLKELPTFVIKTLIDEMKKVINQRFDSNGTEEDNKIFAEKALEISSTIAILSTLDEQITRMLFAVMSETFRILDVNGAKVAESLLKDRVIASGL